ncbi:MAG: hypothetical protein WC054_00360 [Candidatus Nanopelagicales bacterium]
MSADEMRAKFRSLQNALEMLRQIKDHGAEFDVDTLVSCAQDGWRVVNAAEELVDLLRASGFRTVEAALGQD